MDVLYSVRKAKILQLSFSTKRNPSMERISLDKQVFLNRHKAKKIHLQVTNGFFLDYMTD